MKVITKLTVISLVLTSFLWYGVSSAAAEDYNGKNLPSDDIIMKNITRFLDGDLSCNTIVGKHYQSGNDWYQLYFCGGSREGKRICSGNVRIFKLDTGVWIMETTTGAWTTITLN